MNSAAPPRRGDRVGLPSIPVTPALSLLDQLVTADAARLRLVKATAAEPHWVPSLRRLSEDATRAATAGPWTVMSKSTVPPSGNRHDYCTLSEYFWPDPLTSDGLPWILRDGHLNPESVAGSDDANQLRHMANGSLTLALNAWLTDSAPDADRAAAILRRWFLDPDTAMRPHLRYSSMVPGWPEPPGWGLIRCHPFIAALDAERLLSDLGAWTTDDSEQLTEWMAEFLSWMLSSSMWTEELERGNNHTSWCLATGLALALRVDELGTARELVPLALGAILDQIELDGRQPAEESRSRGYFYANYNLDALMTCADLLHRVDALEPSSTNGGHLMAAAERLAPFIDQVEPWPQPLHIEWDRTLGASALHRAVARQSAENRDDVRVAQSLARAGSLAAKRTAREWLCWDTGQVPSVTDGATA